MLLKSLHHDSNEVQDSQQFSESLLAQDAVSRQLKHTQDTALHCTDLHKYAYTTLFYYTPVTKLLRKTHDNHYLQSTHDFTHRRYLHVKDVAIIIQTLREETGHEVIHIFDVSYFHCTELQQMESVALPKSWLVQLTTKSRGKTDETFKCACVFCRSQLL